MDENELKQTWKNELKEKVLTYFKEKDGFDSTLTFLMKELKLDLKDIELLQYCLEELIDEGWIEKSCSRNHVEYDPGKKLDFGGLRPPKK